MRSLLLFVLAGCNQLFGLEPTVVLGADARIDAPGCADSPFVDPHIVAGNEIDTDFDPTLSADGKELWVSRNDNSGNGYDLLILTRANATAPFDTATPFAHNSSQQDGDAALSGDGLVLLFISQRLGGSTIFQSTRPSLGAAFSLPTTGGTGASQSGAGIDLSFDGLTLYYINSDGELESVHRNSRAEPFGPPSPPLAPNVTWPSLSPDELELFYQRQSEQGIYRRTRPSPTVPFDNNEMVISGTGGDPDVSSDSRELYFSGSGIYVMTRTCN